MNRVAVDLATLSFICMEPGGVALFVDGDDDEIRLSCSGDSVDIQVAIGELAKAVEAAAGYRQGSSIDPRD